MDIKDMTDAECFELGRRLGAHMSIHQQKKVFEGVQAGFDEWRLNQHVGGDAILGPWKLLSPIIEMYGRMDLSRKKQSTSEQQQMNA